VLQRSKGFEADMYVPVWTSQLFVSDWLQPGDNPLSATVKSVTSPKGIGWEVTVQNRLDRELKEVRLAVRHPGTQREQLFTLGNVPPGRTTTYSLDEGGVDLRDFVMQNGAQFLTAAQTRQHAFGDNSTRWLEMNAAHLTAVSFISRLVSVGQGQRGFVCPAGVELSGAVERGDAVLLAWDPGHAPGNTSMNRFKAARSHRDTFYRLVVPLGPPRL
jgi:hypothetical protein